MEAIVFFWTLTLVIIIGGVALTDIIANTKVNVPMLAWACYRATFGSGSVRHVARSYLARRYDAWEPRVILLCRAEIVRWQLVQAPVYRLAVSGILWDVARIVVDLAKRLDNDDDGDAYHACVAVVWTIGNGREAALAVAERIATICESIKVRASSIVLSDARPGTCFPHVREATGICTTVRTPIAVLARGADSFAVNIRAWFARHASLFVEFQLLASQWGLDFDSDAIRRGLSTQLQAERRAAEKAKRGGLRVARDGDSIISTIEWAYDVPVAFAVAIHCHMAEYAAHTAWTRNSGRRGADVRGQYLRRVETLQGSGEFSWHGKSYAGATTLQSECSYRRRIPLYDADGSVKRWTTKPGQLRGRMEGREISRVTNEIRECRSDWKDWYAAHVAPVIRERAERYAAKHGVPFVWAESGGPA